MKNRFKDCTLRVLPDFKAKGNRRPGEKKVLIGQINIDYNTFKKTPEERARLKFLKRKS